jgi:uncharacterized protein (TIGR02391 family)
LATYEARPELKRLYATLLKTGLSRFLIKKEFDYILLENDADEIWKALEREVRNESRVAVLIPGFTGYAEQAFLRFMIVLDSQDEDRLVRILCQALYQHSKDEDILVYFDEIRDRFREAEYPVARLDELFKGNKPVARDKLHDRKLTYGLPQLHQRVRRVSEKLFADGYYAQAIFEAYKAVGNLVKEKSGRKDLDGQELMSKVFSYNDPIVKLNRLQSQTDRDEQMGFMFLFMGAMTGIRNPKAHDTVEQADPSRALEYLAFASLLARRVEEGTVSSG